LGNTVTVNDGATGLTINGLTLDNSGPNSCLHLMGESTGLVIDGCAFTGARATAISGEYYAPGLDVTLLESTITCVEGLDAQIFAALDVRRCTISVTRAFLRANSWAGTIDRCKITLSGQAYLSASFAYSGTYSGAVSWTNCLILDLTDHSSITMLSVYNTTRPYSVLGCTIVGVGAYALANIPCIWMGVGAGNLGQVAIHGNIITGFKSGLRGNAGTYTDAYNDVWGCGTNWAAGTAQGATSISADPLFVGGGDYRLQSASPCLGASMDLGLTEDLDGDPRPATGARWDIGCYNGADATPPRVTLAEAVDEYTVDVTFSEPVTGADLTDGSKWTITARDAGSVPSILLIVVDGSRTFVTITTSGMRSEGQYTTEAPATVTDDYSNLINIRTADFDAPNTTPPYVDYATLVAPDTIVVTYSEDMAGASLTDPTKYEIVVADWVSDPLTVLTATLTGSAEVTLTFSGTLTPGGFWTVWAPDDVEDLAGKLIDISRRSYEVLYDTIAAPPAQEGLLGAITAAVGGEMAYLIGTPITRLTSALAPAATTAYVESTLHFPDAGELWIDGERIGYTSRTGISFGGLTRETIVDPADSVAKVFRFDTLNPGTSVRCATRHYSLKDQCYNNLFVRESTGAQLQAVANAKFYPVPLAIMEDEDRQDYVCRRYYQASGPRQTVFEVLESMFRWSEYSGDDGVAVDAHTLAVTGFGNVSKLQDRYAFVDNRICRIVNATDMGGGICRLNLEPNDGPIWQASGLTPSATGISYRILPFRIVRQIITVSSGVYKTANLCIYLYLRGDIPATYLRADGSADTPADGRPIGGQVVPDGTYDREESIPLPTPHLANRHGIYLVNPYAGLVRSIVEDIVPAGTYVKVVSGTA
jgi:hypothetical protein